MAGRSGRWSLRTLAGIAMIDGPAAGAEVDSPKAARIVEGDAAPARTRPVSVDELPDRIQNRGSDGNARADSLLSARRLHDLALNLSHVLALSWEHVDPARGQTSQRKDHVNDSRATRGRGWWVDACNQGPYARLRRPLAGGVSPMGSGVSRAAKNIAGRRWRVRRGGSLAAISRRILHRWSAPDGGKRQRNEGAKRHYFVKEHSFTLRFSAKLFS
jgi:hypothetical protein